MGHFFTFYVLHGNSILNNVLKVYIFGKVVILTLLQYMTDFAHQNLVTEVVG